MKYFLRKTAIFCFILGCITLLLMLVSNRIIDKGDYFKIKNTTKYIILGHSHAECDYNDLIISGLENFGQSSEIYYYTYLKTKKIIEANPQVKTVFIEFTNNRIDKEKGYNIWSDKYLSLRYSLYAPLMNFEDVVSMFIHNPKAILNSQFLSFKENLLFFLKSDPNFINHKRWGGYLYLNRDKTDSLVKTLPKDTTVKYVVPELSDPNMGYLSQTIDFCTQHQVAVYLIRSPLHPRWPNLNNEPSFQKLLKTKFATVEFLDFKNFPLKTTEYGDLNHLNHKGAKIYSQFFDRLLKAGLLSKTNKQEFINTEIEAVRKESH